MEQQEEQKSARGLSAKALKWIAMLTMLIDHIAAAVILPLYFRGSSAGVLAWPLYEKMRLIGRLSFPLFIYLIVESFFHTRNRKRFAAGLFLFALLSELPFDAAVVLPFGWQNVTAETLFYMQNIYFTLLIGTLCMLLSESVLHGKAALVSEAEVRKNKDLLSDRPLAVTVLLCGFITFGGCALASLLRVDYDLYGVLAVILAYWIRKSGRKNLEIFGIVLPLALISTTELFALLDGLLLLAYNGQRGSIRHKWLYYLFYPVHLAVLTAVRFFLLRG